MLIQPAGPHNSDVLNVLDPRVKPEPEKMRGNVDQNDGLGPAPSTKGPHKSDLANILDPKVKPDPSHLGNQGKSMEAPVEAEKQGGQPKSS
ncbi:hypothetical protein B0A50_07063 [Salinomyces thailandicus]|uniref:Uncharacterized protein n=1 Tax=Salinomyces thailandicus TaxID=706561 RepID=A0A4U0TP00_9PEZI|nr:hypothetical protein B0A50_07063 [Salinomyces thailandica]